MYVCVHAHMSADVLLLHCHGIVLSRMVWILMTCAGIKWWSFVTRKHFKSWNLKISLNWSTCTSQMKPYANLSLCLTLLYHSLISTRWSPESQPFRSLQEPDIVELPLHRLVLGPAAQHSSTWRTQINNSLSFNSKSHCTEWIKKSSLNSTANSPSLSFKSSSSTCDILVEGCEDRSLVDQDEHCLKGGAQAAQKEAKDQVGTL